MALEPAESSRNPAVKHVDTVGVVPRHGPALTGAFIVGLFLVFVGQRLIGESGLVRTLLDGAGVAICGGAMIVRLLGRSRVIKTAARVETIAALLYGGGLLALAMYGLTTPAGLDLIGVQETDAGEQIGAIFGSLWVVVLVCTLFPLIFIEISYVSMPVSGAVELRRVFMSGASGLTLALALTYLMALNYTATEFEVRRDLTYFKISMPSESTLRMVKRLDEPIDITLFYPASNEVLDRVTPYFDELSEESSNVRVKVLDHVLAPRLAKEHRVRGNGHVLITRGEQGESFQVGMELESARRRLKKLDSNFQEKFSSVTQPEQIFYTTVGHGERTNRSRDQAKKTGITDLTTFVRRYGLKHRNLGIAQGLASNVPEDASIVAMIGPTEELLPEEVASLTRYLRNGGRLLLLLEPDTPAGLEPVLHAAGLHLEPGKLAHEQLYRLLTDTAADRAAVVTNRYSTHPSVSTVMRAAKGVATVFYHAGHLSKLQGDGPTPNFIVRSVPGTWADRDGDLEYDGGNEARMTYSIAAAVEIPNESGGGGDEGQSTDDEDQDGRAVVIADADVFSDRVFRNEGNVLLAADILLWLSGQEGGAGLIDSEEDDEIEHTRSQDTLWFWGTVFLVPALVLGFGLVYTARRRRRELGGAS